MAKVRGAFNPFYALLLVAGIAFTITACAYGVMALRAVRGADPGGFGNSPGGLIGFMDRHGATLLGAELLVLAIATVGAIVSDGYWIRRAEREKSAEKPKERPNPPV